MYQLMPATEPLSQGDILDAVPVVSWKVPGLEGVLEKTADKFTVRAVILTQACDLTEKKTVRVLVAVVHLAEDLVQKGILKGTTIRDQLTRHKVFGWYFLPGDTLLAELIVDLHALYSVPREFLDDLAQNGKRICRLVTPYREHLAQHFAATYARIALPELYKSAP